MPGGDRKGPDGRGPMSGRGLGYCAENDRPGYETDAPPAGRGGGFGWRLGRGSGWGNGRGRGYGNGFGPGFGRGYGRGRMDFNRSADFAPEKGMPDSLSDEIAGLREQLKALEARVESSSQKD